MFAALVLARETFSGWRCAKEGYQQRRWLANTARDRHPALKISLLC